VALAYPRFSGETQRIAEYQKADAALTR
jgi:hypothetical protein